MVTGAPSQAQDTIFIFVPQESLSYETVWVLSIVQRMSLEKYKTRNPGRLSPNPQRERHETGRTQFRQHITPAKYEPAEHRPAAH
ncbi:MAG: hypothetical protein Q4D81_08845, partial [Eubacteriales bacterium]|nr:hypothetical protein [Eubacteriales bacterium]